MFLTYISMKLFEGVVHVESVEIDCSGSHCNVTSEKFVKKKDTSTQNNNRVTDHVGTG